MSKLLRAVLFFPSVTPSRIILLLTITFVATFFEGFGVAMLFPVMDFIEKGKDFGTLAVSSKMWFYLQRAFDLFHLPKNLPSLMAIVFVLLLLRQSFNYTKSVFSISMTERILSDIRGNGFKAFVKADMHFFDSYGVGRLINALTVDGGRAGGGIFTFFNFLGALLVLLFYVAFLLILSPGMTLFALVILGCIGVILRSRISRSGEIGARLSEDNEKIASAIVERLQGIRLLKLAATEERENAFVRDLSEKIRLNMYDLARIRAKMEALVDPMVIFAGLTILYFSVEVFRMSLAETGIFIFVLLRLVPYTKDLFNSRQALAGFSGSLFRVVDLFREAHRAEIIKSGPLKELTLRKAIRFEKVGFFYQDKQEYVLEDIDLSIPAGKMTALVGRSGAGKSTLVDLLPRLRVSVKGRIWIDDEPIESFDLDTLRRAIAFVSQEGFLFNDTIENNIKYCSPNATREDVEWAARTAYADPFIREFPEGYRTIVGERGSKLSGGQRQRVILARALLQKAKIIILDEPTSSLDSESEKYIQKALDKLRAEGKVTLIVIAHRFSTIRTADQIIVLDKGRVVECGSHGQLIHEENWYADMVKMQQGS